MSIKNEKPFKGINHGTGLIDLRHLAVVAVLMPIEIHLKENGTIDEKPSLSIIMKDIDGIRVVGEISLKMLNEGLEDVGYQITKIE